jgi:hypothetical protein
MEEVSRGSSTVPKPNPVPIPIPIPKDEGKIPESGLAGVSLPDLVSTTPPIGFVHPEKNDLTDLTETPLRS